VAGSTHHTASGEFHAIAAAWPFLMQNASLIIYINERAAHFFPVLATCGSEMAHKVMTVFHCILTFDTLQLKMAVFEK
jgi:hypothetical protein